MPNPRVRSVNASFKSAKDRFQHKVDQDAARIADASLKASEYYLDRANYSINYRRRRALQLKAKADYQERQQARKRQLMYMQEARKVYKDAKLARKEDIQLGPLAPKRDIGKDKDGFGTVSNNLLHPPPLDPTFRAKEELAVGKNRFCVHDRVVVIRGKEVGKIGTVTEVNNDSMQLSIRGFNGVEYLQPDWMAKAQNDPRKYLPTNLKIPFRDCRLVVAAIVNKKGEFQEPKVTDLEAEEFQDETEELKAEEFQDETEELKAEEFQDEIEELEPEIEEEEQTWTTKEFILDHVDLRKRLVPARLHDSVRILPKILGDPTYMLDAAARENRYLRVELENIQHSPEKYVKGKLLHGYKWEEIRVIPGTSIEIADLAKDDKEEIDPSWEEGFDPDAEVYPGDTLQYNVEFETYTPRLTKPPFPRSVLSELQTFNSRTAPINRIKPSILSNREAKFAQLEAQKILREEKMKTPLQVIKERRLEVEKQVLEKRRLSDDELFAKLGVALQQKRVPSGPNVGTRNYLAKMQEEKDSRAARRVEKRRALEEAAWEKKMKAEDKKRLEPSEMKGNLRYEKVVDIWPTDPKAREAQRAARRAEREAALIAEAKITQFQLTKSNLHEVQDTLAAKVQAIQEEIAKTEGKCEQGTRRRRVVAQRISKLQGKLVRKTVDVSQKTESIAKKTLALDKQVEAAERMRRDILAQANEAMRAREAELIANTRWY
ncbi:KOW motif domain-containing protein [Venturia nashicola]|uniref:KOW motif domain-containing protein n=1 Tax=Venturia nashicola TaxID=86259 RepID=A0A4Z1NIG3_9PEZI|nr:KOW motif domain-containing protein [Venturia nashicola]TLD18863.1 KOW motif domain-containing protein [Venturia nashicola]